MKISHRGLYALKALIHLAEAYDGGLVKIHGSPRGGDPREVPRGDPRHAQERADRERASGDGRAATGCGSPPPRSCSGDVVRIDRRAARPVRRRRGARHRVKTEPRHAGLFDLFLDVRNAAAAILDHTSLADLVERNRASWLPDAARRSAAAAPDVRRRSNV